MMKFIFTIALTALMTGCFTTRPQAEEPFADITAEEARAMMHENPRLQIIDVRTDAECAEGMITGAEQIDISKGDFTARLETLDREASYLVYCHSGGRSSRAQQVMKDMGFQRVYNLSGGYMQWNSGQ